MKWHQILLVFLILCCATSCLANENEYYQPSFSYTDEAPQLSENDILLFEDDEFKIIQSFKIYVFRKNTSDWLQILSISSSGAILGREPAFEEVLKRGSLPPSIGWDHRPLRNKPYIAVGLALTPGNVSVEKIEKDLERNELVFKSGSSWKEAGFEEVETVLRIKAKELRNALSGEQSKLPVDVKEAIYALLENDGGHPSPLPKKQADALDKLESFEEPEPGFGEKVSDGSYSKEYYFRKCAIRWVFRKTSDGKEENSFDLVRLEKFR